MNILLMMLRAARPSRISDMQAVSKPRWIPKGYDGLTFFGHIITHSIQEAEAFNKRFSYMKNHEMIHLYQARSTHDSWLRFYWCYFVFWLKGCRYRKHLRNAGYLLNPFEMEAYAHMNDLNYLQPGGEATGWKTYAHMPLEKRLEIYLESKRQKPVSKAEL